MHFERLVIEAGSNTFSLVLHPRLTVIGGMGDMEREGLVTELVAAMGSGRAGVHLEVSSDAGNRYTIFRPSSGRHRVVDVDSARDVTASFTTADGSINMLARAGLDPRKARRAMRVTESDLTTQARNDTRLAHLAAIDQGRLWDLARKVRDREARLAQEAEAVGSVPEDAEAIAEIDRRHQAFERAEATHEKARRISFLVAANLTMAAVPAATLVSESLALPFVAAGAAVTAYSLRTWRGLERARRDEAQALEAAGAQSYMAFHLDRVNRLMADDIRRKSLIRAAEDHRAALTEWRVLVGDDLPVEWAVEHRAEVRRLANDRSGTEAARAPGDVVAEVTATMHERLGQLRQLGPGGESFPALFDEAFTTFDADTKVALLDRLLDASARQQVIILTGDLDVVRWARRELGTGRLGLLEPTPEPAAREAEPRRRRAGHLVA